ncbi:MAG: hypothetical protein RMI32_06275 [Candidatus Nitrosocaldus sp.]|nr:hypothetical protein [Candidatus Nitrosocaldus sp.]
MEIAVDEFIIDMFVTDNEKDRQIVEDLVSMIRRKCHRLVFDNRYVDRIHNKIKEIARHYRNDTYVSIMINNRLRSLLSNSSKTVIRAGVGVKEIDEINDPNDRLVVMSALSICSNEKLLITTDSDILGRSEIFKKYGIRMVVPHEAISIL